MPNVSENTRNWPSKIKAHLFQDKNTMKQIWLDLKTHLREDFSWKSYSLIIGLVVLLTALSYSTNIEAEIYNNSSSNYFVFYSIFYPILFYVFVFLKSGITPFKNKTFMILSFIYVYCLAANTGFIGYKSWIEDLPLYERFYVRNIIANSKGLFIIMGTMALVYFAYERKNLPNFYGLSFKNHNFKPYLWLLLLMVPLIAGAATQADFLKAYPAFKPWKYESIYGLSTNQMAWIFEGFYLFDFIRVEAIFRGALVIGLARFLGKDSVLIMAALYCVFHFGKPLGETISSLFGGYLLGVIALRQINIIGGCIVHMGIAGLMNLAAHIAHMLNS